MARRKQARASSGAPGLQNGPGIGPALNPLGINNQPGRFKRGHYLDPTVALEEWESELSIWFKDEQRVAAFSQPVKPRNGGSHAKP
jgi:hypothetical protein